MIKLSVLFKRNGKNGSSLIEWRLALLCYVVCRRRPHKNTDTTKYLSNEMVKLDLRRIIPDYIVLIGKIAILFLFLFAILRGILLWHYLFLAKEIPPSVLIHSFLVGIRFDLSVTGYILAPVVLLGFLPAIGFSSSRVTGWIALIYLSVMAIASIIICVVDFEFFGYYNSRLNHLILSWNDTPTLALKMALESFPVVRHLLVVVILGSIFVYLLSRWMKSMVVISGRINLSTWLITYPLVLLLTFLAIRGRVNFKAPLNRGVAYFSTYDFANQLALNCCYTFMRDAVLDKKARETASAQFKKLPQDEAFLNTNKLLGIHYHSFSQYPFARIETQEPQGDLNVIVLLMETEASVFISSCEGKEDLAPEFDRIAEQGLLFPNFFSSGSHTYSGIFTTLTGLPTLPGKSLMKLSEGEQPFAGLEPLLAQRGYHRFFYLTHDPHFDNMQGFLISSSFERVIGQGDYPAKEVVSSMGVPDEVMYHRALNDFATLEKPFLAVFMTGSAHGPYIHPDRPYRHADPADPNALRFNAFSYADWALGWFFDEIIASEWGKQTLIVVLGDHGLVWKPEIAMDYSLFRVPLLLVCPGVVEPGVDYKIGGQKDVVATVMDVLGGDWINNTLGTSMMTAGDGHALFIRNASLGIINHGKYLTINEENGDILYPFNDYHPFASLKPEHNPEIQKLLEDEAYALLTSTFNMVQSMRCGIPSLE